MSNSSNKSWYALYVNVRHEKKVVQKLLEKGMEAYVPLVKKMQQWSDRKKAIEVPLITGYIFARLGESEMDKPRYVAGVVNYVRFDGRAALIRDNEIEGMKYFTENGFSLEEMRDDIKVGDRVIFNLSEFKQFTAIVEDFIGDNFALITFEGVKKNFKLKAPIKALKTGKI